MINVWNHVAGDLCAREKKAENELVGAMSQSPVNGKLAIVASLSWFKWKRLLPSSSLRLGGIHHCHQWYYSEYIWIGTHLRLLFRKLGSSKPGYLDFQIVVSGRHYSRRQPNLKFTRYGHLETWIEVCPYGHHLKVGEGDRNPENFSFDFWFLLLWGWAKCGIRTYFSWLMTENWLIIDHVTKSFVKHSLSLKTLYSRQYLLGYFEFLINTMRVLLETRE